MPEFEPKFIDRISHSYFLHQEKRKPRSRGDQKRPVYSAAKRFRAHSLIGKQFQVECLDDGDWMPLGTLTKESQARFINDDTGEVYSSMERLLTALEEKE